jgi:hypothetical protein
MAVEPLSLIFHLLGMANSLRFLENEMRAYREALRDLTDLFAHVDATRKRLAPLRAIPDEQWIDSELAKARSALARAETIVRSSGGGVAAMLDAVEWHWKHRQVVRAQANQLSMCHRTLLNIRDVLAREEHNMQPHALRKYFQETRAQMLASLSKRVARNAAINSGVGVQLSRSRLMLEPGLRSVCFSLLSSTL